MAEATERPASEGAAQTSLPAPPAAPAPEVYRPLSLLALAGFLLAVLYVAVMGVSGLVALFSRSPLLLPGALFLVPLAAAVVSWLGRGQVLASEGTRSGLAFARWGIGLSLVSGLLYGCYYAGTYFAVRQQATALAEQWMDLLRQGEMARAFRLTIPPAFRPADDAKLGEELDAGFNTENSPTMTWHQFRQQYDFPALFRQGNGPVQAQPLGVAHWDYDKGAYQVDLRYRITTPNLTVDAVVGLAGTKAPAREYEGREWQVLAAASRPVRESMRMTPEGEDRMRAAMEARSVVERWNRSLGDNLNDAWLGTLPAAERQAAARVLPRCQACWFPALTGTAVLGTASDTDRNWIAGRLAFAAGSLVHEDPKAYPMARNADQMRQALRGVFASGPGHRQGRLSLASMTMPTWEDRNGTIRFLFPGQVSVVDEARTGPQFTYEVVFVVDSDPPGAPADQPRWHVRSLDVIGGRTPEPRAGPGGGLPPGRPPGGAPGGGPGRLR